MLETPTNILKPPKQTGLGTVESFLNLKAFLEGFRVPLLNPLSIGGICPDGLFTTLTLQKTTFVITTIKLHQHDPKHPTALNRIPRNTWLSSTQTTFRIHQGISLHQKPTKWGALCKAPMLYQVGRKSLTIYNPLFLDFETEITTS